MICSPPGFGCLEMVWRAPKGRDVYQPIHHQPGTKKKWHLAPSLGYVVQILRVELKKERNCWNSRLKQARVRTSSLSNPGSSILQLKAGKVAWQGKGQVAQLTSKTGGEKRMTSPPSLWTPLPGRYQIRLEPWTSVNTLSLQLSGVNPTRCFKMFLLL